MTDTKFMVILGGVIILTGLMLSSIPIIVELRAHTFPSNPQTYLPGLIILVIGAILLIVPMVTDRRSN